MTKGKELASHIRITNNYRAAEIEEIIVIREAFSQIEYELYGSNSHEHLKIEDTILAMNQEGTKPKASKEKIKFNLDMEDPLRLRWSVARIDDFTKKYYGNGSHSGSYGYYHNDPINLASIFIGLQIKEICSYYNEVNPSIFGQTQKNLLGLEKFMDHIIGKFPGTIARVKEFKKELVIAQYNLQQARIKVDQRNKTLGFGTILNNCKQHGIGIIDNISLYVVNVLMSHLLEGKTFDIERIYRDKEVRKAFDNSKLGREIVSLCYVPEFESVVHNRGSSKSSYVEDRLLIQSTDDDNTPSRSRVWANPYEDELLKNTNLISAYKDTLKHLQLFSQQLIACEKLERLVDDKGKAVCWEKGKEIRALGVLMLSTLYELKLSIDNLKSSINLIRDQWAHNEAPQMEVLIVAMSSNAQTLDLIEGKLEEFRREVELIAQKVGSLNIYELMKEIDLEDVTFSEYVKQLWNHGVKSGLLSKYLPSKDNNRDMAHLGQLQLDNGTSITTDKAREKLKLLIGNIKQLTEEEKEFDAIWDEREAAWVKVFSQSYQEKRNQLDERINQLKGQSDWLIAQVELLISKNRELEERNVKLQQASSEFPLQSTPNASTDLRSSDNEEKRDFGRLMLKFIKVIREIFGRLIQGCIKIIYESQLRTESSHKKGNQIRVVSLAMPPENSIANSSLSTNNGSMR